MMTTRRTQRQPAPLTHRDLAAIKAHAARPRNCYDNSAYVARMRQLERHVLLLVQETML